MLESWPWVQEDFIIHIAGNCYAVKLKTKSHDEEYLTRVLCQRDNVLLSSVIGYRPDTRRERLLGYCLIFIGSPVFHTHTWYVTASYSPVKETKHRDWKVIFDDDEVRLVRVGIGVFDWMFSRLPRNVELRRRLDQQGNSDNAVYIETEALWKLGL